MKSEVPPVAHKSDQAPGFVVTVKVGDTVALQLDTADPGTILVPLDGSARGALAGALAGALVALASLPAEPAFTELAAPAAPTQ